jgi:lipopolysaccharide/colanic/teichoic acid biosynthesis glycosyltransferase
MPRWLDLLMALLAGVILLPLAVVIAVIILLVDGAPVFHLSERAGRNLRVFRLIKFRTMRPVTEKDTVTGDHKANRITRTGRILRRSRLDEIPQIWNVLRGDMSLVGPRPPLPRYTHELPTIYGPLLQNRPGITGLASVLFNAIEERILSKAETPEDVEVLYVRKCIPQKARLDTFYIKMRTVWLDLYIVWLTIARFLPLPGKRSHRINQGSRILSS